MWTRAVPSAIAATRQAIAASFCGLLRSRVGVLLPPEDRTALPDLENCYNETYRHIDPEPVGRWRRGGRCRPSGPQDPNIERTIRSRSEEHTSELQYLMRNSYAVFCL